MIKKKKPDSITMLLGPSTTIEGTVEFEHTVRLEGKVIGKIHSTEGKLIVGETAVVNGEIMVNFVIITGRVNGKIYAGKRVEVYPPGRIEGDIHSPSVLIESGVVFNGYCTMKM
jgi:cytoskeletal protein CcmA (bactofilin family)